MADTNIYTSTISFQEPTIKDYSVPIFPVQLTPNIPRLPGIKRVIFNDPATIVYWYDGTKTVVKSHAEEFDREKGLAMAISKKALGNKGNYFEYFKHYLKDEGE